MYISIPVFALILWIVANSRFNDEAGDCLIDGFVAVWRACVTVAAFALIAALAVGFIVFVHNVLAPGLLDVIKHPAAYSPLNLPLIDWLRH